MPNCKLASRARGRCERQAEALRRELEETAGVARRGEAADSPAESPEQLSELRPHAAGGAASPAATAVRKRLAGGNLEQVERDAFSGWDDQSGGYRRVLPGVGNASSISMPQNADLLEALAHPGSRHAQDGSRDSRPVSGETLRGGSTPIWESFSPRLFGAGGRASGT